MHSSFGGATLPVYASAQPGRLRHYNEWICNPIQMVEALYSRTQSGTSVAAAPREAHPPPLYAAPLGGLRRSRAALSARLFVHDHNVSALEPVVRSAQRGVGQGPPRQLAGR